MKYRIKTVPHTTIFRLGFLLFLILPVNTFTQSLPDDANLEVLENKEIYGIFLEGTRHEDAAKLIAKNAIIYWNYGVYDSAVILMEQAAEIFEKEESYVELKTAYTNLGSIFIEKEDYPSAFKYYNRSLDVSKQVGNNEEVIVKTMDLSNAYLFAKEHDKAVELANQALNIARQDENHILVLNCMNQISDIYHKQGDKWKAHEYYVRFNHYQDSIQGNYWNLKSMLVQEKVNFDIEQQEEVKTDMVAKEQVITESTSPQQPKEKPVKKEKSVTSDYMAQRKKQAFQSMDSVVPETVMKDSTELDDLLKSPVEKGALSNSAKFLIVVAGVVLLVVVLLILFLRKKQA